MENTIMCAIFASIIQYFNYIICAILASINIQYDDDFIHVQNGKYWIFAFDILFKYIIFKYNIFQANIQYSLQLYNKTLYIILLF